MKSIFCFGILLTLLSFRYGNSHLAGMEKPGKLWQDSVYSIPVSDIDGASTDLESFRGRKMLIIILPLSAEDTSVTITELNAIQNRYGDSLVVIGVPAEEFGYTPSIKQQIKNLYSTQPPGFIIVEGMKVKKSSGTGQSPLFQWLTDRNKNRYFDRDVKGTGDKFFIDEKGQLYASVSAQVKLSGPVAEKMLSKPVEH